MKLLPVFQHPAEAAARTQTKLMKKICSLWPLGCLVGLMLGGQTDVNATSLLLDFGPTAVAAADALRSPGHAAGAVPAAEITWNRIVGDTNTLYYGDGAPLSRLGHSRTASPRLGGRALRGRSPRAIPSWPGS